LKFAFSLIFNEHNLGLSRNINLFDFVNSNFYILILLYNESRFRDLFDWFDITSFDYLNRPNLYKYLRTFIIYVCVCVCVCVGGCVWVCV
jgi:hypothetical protein